MLALNESARMCGDYTSHPHHPPDTPHIIPTCSPPITALSINPTAPPITNLKDASCTTYISRALGSPSNTTLLNAIRRGYIQIRGLTPKLLLRNPPQSLSIALGHLDLVRKNLRSTKTPPLSTFPCTSLSSFFHPLPVGFFRPHLPRLPPLHPYLFPRRVSGIRPNRSFAR